MRKGTRSGRAWAGAGALALAVATIATTSVAAQAAIAAKSNNATFQVHMKLSGAVSGSLSYKVVELDTPCVGGTGLGSAGENGVPSPQNIKFNGVQLQYAINNAAYKGPGTYPTKDWANTTAAISADKTSESDPFAPANNSKATETLVWNKSGAGSFTFAGWANGADNRKLGGTFTWTCSN